MNTLLEGGIFTRLSDDDLRRPITINQTIPAAVPSDSEQYLRHDVHAVTFSDGTDGYHHRADIPDGAMLVHIGDDDTLGMMRNWRHAISRDSVEFPSGGVEDYEAAELQRATTREQRDAILARVAARECGEEMGIAIDPNVLTRFWPDTLKGSVSFANYSQDIFLAQGDFPAIPPKPDRGESTLARGRISIDEAAEMVGGPIVETATVACVIALCQVYGYKPSWLPTLTRKRTPIS